jgi:hypothetical protein
MPTLDDVYRKFGEVSEAAQIVETDLGTMLLFFGVVDDGLIKPTLQVDGAAATELLHRINRQTFGQLMKNTKRHTDVLDQLEPLLWKALQERNRLTHSFYRQHNLRRNSEAGRAIMMEDLNDIHEILLETMKALSRLAGIDLERLAEQLVKARSTDEDSPDAQDENSVFHVPI